MDHHLDQETQGNNSRNRYGRKTVTSDTGRFEIEVPRVLYASSSAIASACSGIMTDNGVSFRSLRYAKALRRLRIKHKRTKPYTPRTNGKAERFVQTSLREWAYAKPYTHSSQRAAELPIFLERYNHQRPHCGIGGMTPISRLGQNNLSRLNS